MPKIYINIPKFVSIVFKTEYGNREYQFWSSTSHWQFSHTLQNAETLSLTPESSQNDGNDYDDDDNDNEDCDENDETSIFNMIKMLIACFFCASIKLTEKLKLD